MNIVKGEGLRVKGGTPGASHALPPLRDRRSQMKHKVHRIHFVGIGVDTSREQCLPRSGRCDRPREAWAADGHRRQVGVPT